MSMLQEFEQIRKSIGEKTYKKIVAFLKEHPHYYLSDIYYKQQVWEEMEKWKPGKGIK